MTVTLGRNMRFIRLKKALGMTNAELAEKLGKSYKTVEGWSGGVPGKNVPEKALVQIKALLRRKIETSQRLLETI